MHLLRYTPTKASGYEATNELFIQQNLLLYDRTILFFSNRHQRRHRLDNHWPLLGHTTGF